MGGKARLGFPLSPGEKSPCNDEGNEFFPERARDYPIVRILASGISEL